MAAFASLFAAGHHFGGFSWHAGYAVVLSTPCESSLSPSCSLCSFLLKNCCWRLVLVTEQSSSSSSPSCCLLLGGRIYKFCCLLLGGRIHVREKMLWPLLLLQSQFACCRRCLSLWLLPRCSFSPSLSLHPPSASLSLSLPTNWPRFALDTHHLRVCNQAKVFRLFFSLCFRSPFLSLSLPLFAFVSIEHCTHTHTDRYTHRLKYALYIFGI